MNSPFETLTYVKQLYGSRLLIKLGGSVLEDAALVERLCIDLSLLQAAGITPIIVHGGGRAIDKALQVQGLTSTFHQGLRVTDPKMMDTIEATLCGQVNKRLVRQLNACGARAVGLSGSDDHLLQCTVLAPEYGLVGNIEQVNTLLLEQLLAATGQTPVIPVIAPIGVDASGQALNVNADWAASRIALALGMHKLMYLTDQDGILDANGQTLSQLTAEQLQHLIDHSVVQCGMLTKVKTVLNALQHGLDHIHIINAKKNHAILDELFTHQGSGTLCRRMPAWVEQEGTPYNPLQPLVSTVC